MSEERARLSRILRRIGEAVREIATRQGNIPFLTGDLRKSIVVQVHGATVTVGSNLPYARAVHDGRPALTIRPKNKKALHWPGAAFPVRSVHQPARQGRPFLTQAMETLGHEGLPESVRRELGELVTARLEAALRRGGR